MAVFFTPSVQSTNMATAARAVKETECRVCGEDYIDPKILPCGHLLCRDCITSRLSSATEPACPQCACAIVTAEERSGRSLAEIADALPTDLAMESLVESMQVLGQEHSCCVCAAPAVCICYRIYNSAKWQSQWQVTLLTLSWASLIQSPTTLQEVLFNIKILNRHNMIYSFSGCMAFDNRT